MLFIHRRFVSGCRVGSVHARALTVLAALLVMVLNSGCTRNDRFSVAPVRGRVVYQGQGVPGATVIFFPEGDTAAELGKLRPAAYADNDGNFEIKTYVSGDGAPPGMYRVSIIAASAPTPGRRMKDQKPGEQASPGQPGPRIPPAVTTKYANVDTAGIEVTVEEGENNLAPFELTMGAGPNARAVTSGGASSISSRN